MTTEQYISISHWGMFETSVEDSSIPISPSLSSQFIGGCPYSNRITLNELLDRVSKNIESIIV